MAQKNPYVWVSNMLHDREFTPIERAYRVTAWRVVHGRTENDFIVGDFRWYWSACAAALAWHFILGFNCNIWQHT